MKSIFRKRFAVAAAIFAVALFVGIGIDIAFPMPKLPLIVQIVAGIAAVILGAILIRRSMECIEAAENTYDPYVDSSVLATSGVFRYSRNPVYLGLAIIQLGFAMLIDSPWIAATMLLAITVTDRFVIKLEEERLKQAFGEPYLEYTRRVRRWF